MIIWARDLAQQQKGLPANHKVVSLIPGTPHIAKDYLRESLICWYGDRQMKLSSHSVFQQDIFIHMLGLADIYPCPQLITRKRHGRLRIGGDA